MASDMLAVHALGSRWCTTKKTELNRLPACNAADPASADFSSRINEQFLFHGASKGALAAICAQGFDARVCAASSRYGQVTRWSLRLQVMQI